MRRPYTRPLAKGDPFVACPQDRLSRRERSGLSARTTHHAGLTRPPVHRGIPPHVCGCQRTSHRRHAPRTKAHSLTPPPGGARRCSRPCFLFFESPKNQAFSNEDFPDLPSEGVRAGDHRRAARDLRAFFAKVRELLERRENGASNLLNVGCPRFVSYTPPTNGQSRLQKPRDSFADTLDIRQLAFPNDEHLPPIASKALRRPSIPCDVPLQLGHPPRPPRRWNAAPAARVHVPEAPADFDYLFMTRKDEVRRAGKTTNMETEAIAGDIMGSP
jgi:hypothetical protein